MRVPLYLVVSLALGCGTGGGVADPQAEDPADSSAESDAAADAGQAPDAAPPETGQALYTRLCAACHGPTADGVTGPALHAWADRPRDQLVDRIDRTMPSTDPSACVGQCAEAVSDYLRTLLDDPTNDCLDAPTPARLRLLSHREYCQSIDALLYTDGPCPPVRFELQAQATTVHVAGDFNDWAPTVAAGGWPMDNDGDRWTLERSLPAGRYAYKYVVDEQEWLADPNRPGEPDGFGGNNSVVQVDCGDAAPDVSDLLPAEPRPEDYPYDNHVSAAVDAVRLEAYLEAAARFAQAAPCPDADCFVQDFLPRAFRRPITGAESTRYRAAFQDDPSVALQAALSSPAFLYRDELDMDQAQIAAALSYFLWGAPPPDDIGDLSTPDARAAAARAMLDDPRGRRTISHFAAHWLGIQGVATTDKSPVTYPDFDPALRAAFLEETQRLVGHVVYGSGRFADLLTAEYTFGDPRLANHYGLQANGERLPYAGRRAGILGHGSVLATYAHSDQSSPIRRGLFVRRALLCQPLPPPPANAGGVPDVDPNASTRERFRQHTDDPFCASCHQYIDDVGFGFEHFDGVGAWRDDEAGQSIDARGDMNDVEGLGTGTRAPYDSLPELARTLAESRAAADCFVTQLYRFAHGRLEGPADRCALSELQDSFTASNGDIPALLEAIVAHPSFVNRRAP